MGNLDNDLPSQYINYYYCYEDKIPYKKWRKGGRVYLWLTFEDVVHHTEEIFVAGLCHACPHYISSQEKEMTSESWLTFSFFSFSFCPEPQPNEWCHTQLSLTSHLKLAYLIELGRHTGTHRDLSPCWFYILLGWQTALAIKIGITLLFCHSLITVPQAQSKDILEIHLMEVCTEMELQMMVWWQ